MKNIGRFPLWVVVLTWFLQRRQYQRYGVIGKNYLDEEVLTRHLRAVLPVPKGRLETWALTRVVSWTYEHLRRLFRDMNLIRGVSGISIYPANKGVDHGGF